MHISKVVPLRRQGGSLIATQWLSMSDAVALFRRRNQVVPLFKFRWDSNEMFS